MDPAVRKARLFQAGFVAVGLLVVLTLLLGPFALLSVFRDSGQKHVDDAFAISPTTTTSPTYTRLHLDIMALDETQRLATVHVSGYHYCASDCGAKLKATFFSLDADGRGANSIPPSASVAIPANAAEVNDKVQLPVGGNLLRYPFDTYRLRLGAVLEKVNPDNTSTILAPADARNQLIMTVQEQVPRLEMNTPTAVDPASVQPPKAPFQYLYVSTLALGRPMYLKILVALMVLLITAASIYAVLLRPFDQLILNASALVFGVWGVRSLILGSYPPDATIVDVLLLVVIFLLLGTVTFRGMNYMHRNGNLQLLPWARPPKPAPQAAAPVDVVAAPAAAATSSAPSAPAPAQVTGTPVQAAGAPAQTSSTGSAPAGATFIAAPRSPANRPRQS